MSYDMFLQPRAIRYHCLWRYLPVVLSTAEAEFRDEVSFRHWVLIPRRVSAALSVQFGAEARLFPESLRLSR
jgi:hypothetical protein